MDRIHSIDSLKGGAVIGLIFFHCAVYHYGSIDSVDMDNPPFLITIIGIMVLWGGLFALMSGLVNTFRYDQRIRARGNGTGQEAQGPEHPRRRLFVVGLALVVLHVVYNALGSPTSFDFDTGNHQYSLVAGLLRTGHLVFSPRRMVEGTALLMLGINLMLLSIILPVLAARNRPERWSALLSFMVLASGLLRFVFFPIYHGLVADGRYLLAFFLSPFAPNPYPVFPYFAFTCAGAAFGFSLSRERRAPPLSGVVGALLVALGITGAVVFPTDLAGVSAFWFSKVFLELGVFVVLAWSVVRVAGFGSDRRHIIHRVARMSLTVYLLQTVIAEAAGAGLTALFPGWNRTIGAALLFGVANVAFWLGIVALWSRASYRFTVEDLWVRVFPGSTKLIGVTRGA